MKNNGKIGTGRDQENREIKCMLMELADGHQEMMAMLREIIRKDRQKEEHRDRDREREYSREK